MRQAMIEKINGHARDRSARYQKGLSFFFITKADLIRVSGSKS